jgi:hypothetical protein
MGLDAWDIVVRKGRKYKDCLEACISVLELKQVKECITDFQGIDCEMVYTTYGTELARVTFVGSNLEVL